MSTTKVKYGTLLKKKGVKSWCCEFVGLCHFVIRTAIMICFVEQYDLVAISWIRIMLTTSATVSPSPEICRGATAIGE